MTPPSNTAVSLRIALLSLFQDTLKHVGQTTNVSSSTVDKINTEIFNGDPEVAAKMIFTLLARKQLSQSF